MMKRNLALCFLLGLILLPADCTSQPPSAPTLTSDLGLHLLVEVTGNLSHKRPGWAEYLPLSFGTVLDRGDLLHAAPGAQGVVVCTDFTLVEVPGDYLGGLSCPQSKVTLIRDKSLVVGPQRVMSLAFSTPHILSPRHTFIQTAHPLLRWHPSSTRTITYDVRVWGSALEWQAKTTATEIRYPDDAPPLEEGVPYRLIVVDREGHSSDEEQTALDLGFALLSSEEMTIIKSLVAQAQELSLDERATSLLEAEIYAAHGLRADAIALLEELVAREDVPTLHQRLGDLYLEVGLYTEACKTYEHALDGYHALGQKDGEAHALTGLGLAYRGDQDEVTAHQRLEEALDLYQGLGETDGAIRVESVLAEMGE